MKRVRTNQWIFGWAAALAMLVGVVGAPGVARAAEDLWPAYLDYAYVYSSADSAALRARIAQYGKEAGVSLDKYAEREFAVDADEGLPFDEARRGVPTPSP